MTIRSLYRHNDTFFSHSVPSEDNHRYACSPPFTLFISPSSTNHTSSKPFVFSSNKRKPTGIQSTTNAHIDEGPPFRLPLSLLSCFFFLASFVFFLFFLFGAIARKAPVSRLIFFQQADLQSSEARPRAGHCRPGMIDVEIIIGERSRNKSKNRVKFRCQVMTFDHATGKSRRSSRFDDRTNPTDFGEYLWTLP